MSVTVESTTDSPEAVAAASGEKVADPPAPKEPEAPEEKPAGDEEKPSEAPEEKPEAGTEGEAEAPEDEEETKDGTDEEEPEKPPKKKAKGGFQRRIDRLTREKRDLEARVAALEREPEKKPAAGEEKPEGKPTVDNYESYEDFMEALTDWKTDQKLIERDEKERQERQDAARKESLAKWNERSDKVREVHDDYDDVLAGVDVPIPPEMYEALLESEHGPAIAYQLANDPAELNRIVSLSPFAAARELGKIEARIAAPPVKKSSPPKPKASAAPEPIQPVGAKPSGTTVPLDQMDYQDYRRAREQQIKDRNTRM